MTVVDRVNIKKNTDQLNFEDFLGGMTLIVTISKVEKGRKEAQYDISIEGDDRYWRPPATVLKQLVLAYTDEAANWVGKSAELFGDPEVKMKGVKVGGIRVSRLSDIDGPLKATLTVTRGQSAEFTVLPLPRVDILRAEWHRATPERRTAIEAEVAALSGKPTTADPGDVETPDPSDELDMGSAS
jgi:hypothetical protein